MFDRQGEKGFRGDRGTGDRGLEDRGSVETAGQVRQVRSGEARETGEAGVSGKIGETGGSVDGWVEVVIIVTVGIGVLLQLYKLYLFQF